MEKLYTQAEVAKAVGYTPPAIIYARKKGWISPVTHTGKGWPLFSEESVLRYAKLRNLEVDFGRIAA